MIAIVEGADLNSLNTALLSGLTVLPVDPAFDVAHRLLASHFETLFNSAVRQVSSVLAASSSLVAQQLSPGYYQTAKIFCDSSAFNSSF